MEETEEKTKKKLESRKFVVWLVWCVITFVSLGYCIVTVAITKQYTEAMNSFLEKMMGWFFGVTMMYLGCNAGQKVGLGFADAISEKKDEE